METKIRIIKRVDVEKRAASEESERQRRIEISMLQVLTHRYPQQAKRFVRDLPVDDPFDRKPK
jgi:hypothetical protein